MAKDIEICLYTEELKDKWDRFVLTESMNGTFLQSRQFLEYHPQGRFVDHSLLFMNGGTIVAVLPANLVTDDKKTLYSYQGSTFGGLVVGTQFLKISYLDLIFEKLDAYLIENGFDEIILKQPGRIYQKHPSELLDYYLFLHGYSDSQEVGYYVDFSDYADDIISSFSASRRRDYRYALKNDYTFKRLNCEREIRQFYEILSDNYTKFGKLPVHTAEELLDFKFSRLPENTDFYGVYLGGEMIAGSMVFQFDRRVFHTQYLAVRQDKTGLYANEFLYKNLIETAKKEGFSYLSFGTSTLEGGKVLNRPLAQYKEGFGTTTYVNKTYRKNLK